MLALRFVFRTNVVKTNVPTIFAEDHCSLRRLGRYFSLGLRKFRGTHRDKALHYKRSTRVSKTNLESFEKPTKKTRRVW